MNLSEHQGKRLLAGLSTSDIFERITPQVAGLCRTWRGAVAAGDCASLDREIAHRHRKKHCRTYRARGASGTVMTTGASVFTITRRGREIAEYRKFVEQSPIAEIAARLMNVKQVNFFFDAVFVRTPGAQFRTPFHQDEPYWSVEGFDTCTIWMPLVPVERRARWSLCAGLTAGTVAFGRPTSARSPGTNATSGIDSPDKHMNRSRILRATGTSTRY